METHTRPPQIERLVRVIAEGSPGAVILISHDKAGQPIDVPLLESLGNVHVVFDEGGYGDFTHIERYLAAVDWLDAHGVDYDWIENLTGQDYPVRPISEIEEALAATDADGFMYYSPVFPERVLPGTDMGTPGYRLVRRIDALMRYDYRFWRYGKPSDTKQFFGRPFMVLNLVQPWVRLSSSYAAIGIKWRRPLFGPQFPCYGGSFFCTLSAGCARYLSDYARSHPREIKSFRALLAPEEVFFQSVLVNSGKFRFDTDARRYIDWTGCTYTSPRTLGPEDLDKMLASGAHWARKLDLSRGTELFDQLDERVRRVPSDA
jgi:hypothetical protein